MAPNSLLLIVVVDVRDHTRFAKLFSASGNMITALSILFIARTRVIKVQFFDVFEGHVGESGQIGV
jgi:hypothetical protein